MIERSHATAAASPTFEEQHYPIAHWARLWGFSRKTVREWFQDEYGPGVLRQPNIGRRSKRDYTTNHDLAVRCRARVRQAHEQGVTALILRRLR